MRCVCLGEIEKKGRDRQSEMSANLFGKCRKILAIGRNYKLHAEELGNKVINAATPALCEIVIIAVEDDEHMMVLSCILFISHVACSSSSPHPFLSWCGRLPFRFSSGTRCGLLVHQTDNIVRSTARQDRFSRRVQRHAPRDCECFSPHTH